MSAGWTEVEYNGVKIENCQTLVFDQKPVYDEAKNQEYNRFTVRVVGYFLQQYEAATRILPKRTNNESAAHQYNELQHLLTARRKPFKMTLGVGSPGERILLEANPLGLSIGEGVLPADVDLKTDVNNGPIPEVISAKQIVGSASIRVEFEVTICLLPKCSQDYPPDGNSGGELSLQRRSGVLSNRWSCVDDLDENYFTTRTWNGTLRLAHPMRNPHDFRSLVIPPIQPGMRTIKQSYVASEDGLSLRYTIIHEEVEITAPAPAHSIKISHRETVGEHAVTVQTNFSVTVKGDRSADKRQLLLLAMTVADSKLRLQQLIPAAGVNVNRPVFLKTYEVFEESGTFAENMVQVVVRLEHKPTKNGNFGIGFGNGLFSRIVAEFGKKLDSTMIANYVNTLTFGNRPGEEPEWQGPIPLIGAFSTFVQSPCTEDHSMVKGVRPDHIRSEQIYASRSPMPELPQIQATSVPTLPDAEDETFSDAHRDGVYQTYQIDSEYRETTLILQMPIARPASEPAPETPQYPYPNPSPGPNPGPNPSPGPAAGGSEDSEEDFSAFVRIGPSQFQRVVRIVAERLGAPPRLPNPTTQFTDGDGLKNVLLGKTVLGCEPTRTPDGESRRFTLRAEFHYGLSGQPKQMRLGTPDYDERSSQSPNYYDFELTKIFSSPNSVG